LLIIYIYQYEVYVEVEEQLKSRCMCTTRCLGAITSSVEDMHMCLVTFDLPPDSGHLTIPSPAENVLLYFATTSLKRKNSTVGVGVGTGLTIA
jgi:hypothetical protein